MRVLSKAEFITEAEPSLRQVFVNDDAFDQPFSPNVVARRIIYLCSVYIRSPLIDAIVAATSNLGDTGCYIYDLWVREEQHCYIPFSEFSAVYFGIEICDKSIKRKLGLSLSIENILYSPRGKWGVIISHEHHGMLGGSAQFIEDIRQAIPDLERQVYNFIEERLRRTEIGKIPTVVLSWLPELLLHVYGQTTAEKICRI